MPELFVLIGPPGAGKSTWRSSFLLCNPGAVVVSLDDLVDTFAARSGLTYTEAFRKAPLKDFEREVKATFIAAVASGKRIVLDRTNMSRKARGWFLREAKGYQTQAVVFDTHPIVLKDRLARRARETGKDIPGSIVESMLRRYEAPDLAEFDTIATITSDPPTRVQKIRYQLGRLFQG